MRFTVPALGVALATLAASPTLAQSRDESASLSAWDDSLVRASLPQLEQYGASAGNGGGDIGALRHALYQLRQAERRNDRHELDVALTAFELIGAQHRHWAWPPFAAADGYTFLARQHAPPLAISDQLEGELNADAVWRTLAAALRNDPDFPPARRLATTIMVAGGDRELTRDEESILTELIRRRDPEPDVLLIEARDLRRRLRYDSALVIFERSLASGGDSSRLALERARTLRALGQTEAAQEAYWHGLRHLTPAGRELYRFDLAWIVTPDSLAAFNQLPDAEVAGWVRRFWEERDAAAANQPGDRLAEHLRRWVFVHANFRVDRPWRYTQMTRVEHLFEGFRGPMKGWDRCIASDEALYDLLSHEAPVHPGDIRDREPLLDHRGLIYLKHGRPWRTLSQPLALMAEVDAEASRPTDPLARAANHTPGNPVAETDSWLYWFEGGWRLLHFRGSNALGMFRPSTLSGYLPIDPAMYLARADMLPEYAAAAHALLHVRTFNPPSCLDEVLGAVAKSRDDAHTATTADSDTPILTTPWSSAIQLFALGHAAERSGKMLLAFAFSGPGLVALPAEGGGMQYPIHFRAVAYNRATGQSVTLDTVRNYATRDQLRTGQSLTGWLELPLPGGTWQVAVRANEGVDSVGAYMLHRDLVIDSSPRLALSDIVMGREGTGTWPATDGAAFPLNVLDAWMPGGAAQLFYEVRGLNAGDSYQTLIEMSPIRGDPKKGVRITSTDHAAGPVSYIRKALGLNHLVPGRYRLAVTVTHGDQRATRVRELVIGTP